MGRHRSRIHETWRSNVVWHKAPAPDWPLFAFAGACVAWGLLFLALALLPRSW